MSYNIFFYNTTDVRQSKQDTLPPKKTKVFSIMELLGTNITAAKIIYTFYSIHTFTAHVHSVWWHLWFLSKVKRRTICLEMYLKFQFLENSREKRKPFFSPCRKSSKDACFRTITRLGISTPSERKVSHFCVFFDWLHVCYEFLVNRFFLCAMLETN